MLLLARRNVQHDISGRHLKQKALRAGGYFHRPKKPLIQSRYTHISECFLLARLRRRINGLFSDQKGGNKLLSVAEISAPSSAVLLPDAVARWRGRRALPQSPFGRHEVNIAEKRLPSAIPITGRRFTHVFGQCIVCCIAFRLLYRIIVICSRFCWCILY